MPSNDLIEIPFLTVGKTKQDGVEVTDEMFNEIIESYDPLNVHQAGVVNGPHSPDHAESLAWVDRLYKKEIGGRPWGVAVVKPTSPENAKELERVLSGPMKFNSPEGDVLGDQLSDHVRLSVYKKSSTDGWPGKAKNKWHLRRLNLVPNPAQFGMPQAALSDSNGEYLELNFSEAKPMEEKPAQFSNPINSEEARSLELQIKRRQEEIMTVYRNVSKLDARKQAVKDLGISTDSWRKR